jgi:TetR/AcrR family transcriptional regulator
MSAVLAPSPPARLSLPDTRRQRRPDARPAELQAAALDLFAEKGFAATRLDDVAARAGVSKGTLYLYFKNKEELFKAVVRDALVAPFRARRDFVAGYAGPTRDLLQFVLEDWWREFGSTKLSAIPKLIIAEAGNFPDLALFYVTEVVMPVQATLASVFERGMARGEFRRMDARHAATLFTAPLFLASLWHNSLASVAQRAAPELARTSPLADVPLLLQSHLDIMLSGLQAAPVPAAHAPANPAFVKDAT